MCTGMNVCYVALNDCDHMCPEKASVLGVCRFSKSRLPRFDRRLPEVQQRSTRGNLCQISRVPRSQRFPRGIPEVTLWTTSGKPLGQRPTWLGIYPKLTFHGHKCTGACPLDLGDWPVQWFAVIPIGGHFMHT